MCEQQITKEDRDKAYEQVADIAEKHGLVLWASGGIIMIMHPDTQREQGVEGKCLYMAGLGPFPKDTDQTR